MEHQQQAYVLAVSGKAWIWLDYRQQSVKSVLTQLPNDGWQCLSAGAGSKGPRSYDWLRLELTAPVQEGWKRWLMVRRSCTAPTDLAAYVIVAPAATTVEEQARVAGMRWTVEESIQTAKGEVGLDHYEVRSWAGWYRHITLAMWAAAFLAVVRAERVAPGALKKRRQSQGTRSSFASFKAHRRLRSD